MIVIVFFTVFYYFLIRCSNVSQQKNLLTLLWTLWPKLPMYGHKVAQFVDLLGYFTLKTPDCGDKKVGNSARGGGGDVDTFLGVVQNKCNILFNVFPIFLLQ